MKIIFAFVKFIAACALTACLLTILYGLYKIYRLPSQTLGDRFSTRIYSAPLAIIPGQSLSPERIQTRLKRLGYRSQDREPEKPGEYFRRRAEIEIYLRGFSQPFWNAPEQKIDIRWDRSGRIRSASAAYLEPELISRITGPEGIEREAASYSEFPAHLIHAVVAVEDKRFFEHHGVDPWALARAALVNLRSKKPLQGGSTITQQLAKNLFLVPRKALWRKMAEIVLALYLETRYTKEQILTLYLNQAYWGQSGPVSVAGAKAAARFYFNKHLKDLTLSESALLAGLLRSPLRYSPFRDVESALARRNLVLKDMLEQTYIRPPEYEQAIREPLNLNLFPEHRWAGKADYFVSEVIQQLSEKYPQEALFRVGWTIYTTLDPVFEEISQKEISRLPTQGALVALDPASGAVRAMAGGRNFAESQFNRVTQAKRQPGSAFKPFVYGAALRQHDKNGSPFTLSTLVEDRRRRYRTPEGSWSPKNYDGIYHGPVTLRKALSLSLNAATVDLASRIGPLPIIDYAHSLGIQSPLKDELGLALGDSEVTLLELTAAYAPFANGGERIEPYLIEGILDLQGQPVERRQPQQTRVLAPGEAYLITSLLEEVIREGTAKSLKSLGFTRHAAGKTGTSSNEQDAWFIGYTTRWLMGVWVGEDQPRAIGGTGATAALPVWARAMGAFSLGLPDESFLPPEDVLSVKIDPTTGLKAVSGCPQRIQESYLKGTEPKAYCPLHPGGVRGWFRRVFGT